MSITSQDLFDWIIENWAGKANFRQSTEDPSDTPPVPFMIHRNTSSNEMFFWNGDVWEGLNDLSSSDIKQLYESNPDTNAFTDDDKTKVSNLPQNTQFVLDGKIDVSEKGANNGVAELNSDGFVATSQLPSFVSSVEGYSSLSQFPSEGEESKIYKARDTNLIYRWDGSDYTEISPSLALGETAETAYRGDRGKQAFDHTSLTDNPHNVTADQIGLGNVEDGAQVNEPTNLGLGGSGNSRIITSSTGSNVSIPVASTSDAGFMSIDDKSKLSGIESGAEVNPTASEIKSLYESNSNTNVFTDSEKAKLDGIEAGAEQNVGTNLGITGSGNSRTITSSTGSNVSIPVASTSDAGFMSIQDKSKLNDAATKSGNNTFTGTNEFNGVLILPEYIPPS